MPSSTNTADTRWFGADRTGIAKSLYKSYDYITSQVSRVIEVALSLTYDLYHSYVNKKDTDENIKQQLTMIKKRSEVDSFDLIYTSKKFATTPDSKKVLENEFKKQLDSCDSDVSIGVTSITKNDTIDTFGSYVTGLACFTSTQDIGLSIDPNTYLTTVGLLRNELSKAESGFEPFNTEFHISVDVATVEKEFPFIKNYAWAESNIESFGVQVVPILTKVRKALGGLEGDFSTIPEFRYKINIDINRLIYTFSKMYDPSDLTAPFADGENDKDTYISNGLSIFKNLPELITRKAILETYNNGEMIYGNWNGFINRLNCSINKFYKSEGITNIIHKLSHFNSDALKSVTFNFNEFVGEWCAHLVSDYVNFDPFDDFIGALYDATSRYSTDEDRFMKGIIGTYISKLFSVYFTSSVLTNMTLNQENNIKKLHCGRYCREFYESYKGHELLESTTKIADYNIKDFIQSIIKEQATSNMFKPYETKLTSGENAYFVYCKMTRAEWMEELTANFGLISIVRTASTLIKSDPKTLDGIHKSLNNIFSALRMSFKSGLSRLLEQRFMYNIDDLFKNLIGCTAYDGARWWYKCPTFDLVYFQGDKPTSLYETNVERFLQSIFDNLTSSGFIPVTMDADVVPWYRQDPN